MLVRILRDYVGSERAQKRSPVVPGFSLEVA